jgi:hypothetical protein
MKNLNLSSVFYAFLMSVLFVGCTKNEIEPTPSENLTVSIPNPSNGRVEKIDYELWGETHNKGLEYIAVRLDTANLVGKDTNEVILQWVLDFMTTQSPQFQDDNNTLEKLKTAVSDADKPDFSHLSLKGKKIFDTLNSQMDEFSPTVNIAAFQTEIRLLEETIIILPNSRDKDYLLKATAIARYSAAYWYAEFQKGNASVWEKKAVFFSQEGKIERGNAAARIERIYSNRVKKDAGGRGMPDAIGSSGIR